MAIKHIRAGKLSPVQPVITLIRGDAASQIIRLGVNRHYGGVDLSSLAWAVTVENAAGATDTYRLSPILSGDDLEMEWCVGGTATAAPGVTAFTLSGFSEDAGTTLWQSGVYHIRIADTIEYTPGSETEAQLSNVQKMIVYVEGNLENVIRAGEDAESAAEAANKAADRANGVADGANEHRITALEKFTTHPDASYSVTGSIVQLDSLEGMPMNVITRITLAQTGSGDPAPDNIRAITGFDSATLTHNDAEYTRNFGQTVCSGVLDWNTGVLTIDKKLIVFDGTESFNKFSDTTNQKQSSVFFFSGCTDAAKVDWPDNKCSHFANVREGVWEGKYDGTVGICCDNRSSSNVYYYKYFRWGDADSTLADWKAFLAAQYAAGTPVQYCYELAEPIRIQLTPRDIIALGGMNTLHSSAGETTVSGRQDIRWVTDYLMGKIKTLESAIISLGGNV